MNCTKYILKLNTDRNSKNFTRDLNPCSLNNSETGYNVVTTGVNSPMYEYYVHSFLPLKNTHYFVSGEKILVFLVTGN